MHVAVSRRRSHSRTPPPHRRAASPPVNPLAGARRLWRRAPRRLRRSCLYAADADAEQGGGDDRYGFAVPFDEAGRVASRPGYPAEPAARSRPCGRVSLAPPFASLSARSACPAARFARLRRRSHSRTPPCSHRDVSPPLTRHGGSPPVPFPEPLSPSFGTLGQVLPTPFGGSALTPHASLMPGAPFLRSGAQECAGLRQSMINPAESSSYRAGKSSVSLTAPFSQIACTVKLLLFMIKTKDIGSLASPRMLSDIRVHSN